MAICNGVTCIPNARQAFQILILFKNLNKKLRTELYFHVINSKTVGGWGASSVQNLKTCEIILLQLNNSPDISNFNGMVQHATAPLPSAQ